MTIGDLSYRSTDGRLGSAEMRTPGSRSTSRTYAAGGLRAARPFVLKTRSHAEGSCVMASGARTRGRRGRGSVDLSICDRWNRLDYLELASDVRHDEHAMMIRLLVVSALSASAVCTSALAVSPAAS